MRCSVLFSFGACLLLIACDQAIEDRYAGLILAEDAQSTEIVTTQDAGEQTLALSDMPAHATPPRVRPQSVPTSAPLSAEEVLAQELAQAEAAQAALDALAAEQAAQAALLANQELAEAETIFNHRERPEGPDGDAPESAVAGTIFNHAERPAPATPEQAQLAEAAAENPNPSEIPEILLQEISPDVVIARAETLSPSMELSESEAEELDSLTEAQARLAEMEAENAATTGSEPQSFDLGMAVADIAPIPAQPSTDEQSPIDIEQELDIASLASSDELGETAILEALPTPQAQSVFLPAIYSDQSPITSSRQLTRLFAEANYSLARAVAGSAVPGFILQQMPDDLGALGESNRSEMKTLFIQTVLPLCLLANERIEAEQRFLDTQTLPTDLSLARDARVRGLAAKYGATTDRDLRARVDAIPVSLCLAQAIYGSNWGKGRALLAQNALFGPWSSSKADPFRSVPEGSTSGDADAPLRLRSLLAASHAYALFLNRDEAFLEFRDVRQAARAALPISGLQAAELVAAYHLQDTNYGANLIRLIGENSLDQYDFARLADTRQAIPVL